MTAQPPTYRPQPPSALTLTSRHFAVLTALYALAIVYSSLMLGPDGLHYVPITAAEAWRKFRAIHYVHNASDQRPDWIANMMMTIPLSGFFYGALALRKTSNGAAHAAAVTLGISILFILAVKYAQLFFPPRTVTINYIAAQSIGAVLGIWSFRFAHRQLYPTLVEMFHKGEGLAVVLGGYSLLLMAYFLMPFDLALSPGDLAARLSSLPLTIVPGAGHDAAYRALLVLADAAATIPFGMFLAVTGRNLPFGSLVARGISAVVPVTIVSLFILSATPFALSLVGRTAGVALGIWFMWKLKGKDLWKRHYRYAQYVPVAFPVYLVLLALANGLLTAKWFDADQALAALDTRELLPLWSLYITSKADTARNAIVTFIMFAPIGIMIWLRRGFWSRGAGFSAFLALILVAGDRDWAGDEARPDAGFHAPFRRDPGRRGHIQSDAGIVEAV